MRLLPNGKRAAEQLNDSLCLFWPVEFLDGSSCALWLMFQLNVPPAVLLLASSRLRLHLAPWSSTDRLLMLTFAPSLLLALLLGNLGSFLPDQSRFMLLFRISSPSAVLLSCSCPQFCPHAAVPSAAVLLSCSCSQFCPHAAVPSAAVLLSCSCSQFCPHAADLSVASTMQFCLYASALQSLAHDLLLISRLTSSDDTIDGQLILMILMIPDDPDDRVDPDAMHVTFSWCSTFDDACWIPAPTCAP
jgi:hypothetical protein